MYECEMDFSEATALVLGKIEKLEPGKAAYIIGCILLQENGEQEIIRLAFAPDVVIHCYVRKIISALPHKLSNPINPTLVSDAPNQYFPYSPSSSSRCPSPRVSFRPSSSFWESQLANKSKEQHGLGSDYEPLDYSNPITELQNQAQMMSLNEFPVKTCHYFNNGFCKHGNSCRYYHDQTFHESSGHLLGPNLNDFVEEEQLFSPGSLEKLELEITELLKSRRGSPVSIASLPMLYYEKYGKILQADGYLTESQRHGKAGYSLTKLLARLKNSVWLIDRPHGQHAIVLAEDAHRYMDYQSERNDPGPIVSGSRQIYLTFPAESTFSEEDVAEYFNIFGPVEDVRIPCQQKRMFGFVTFDSVDTVKTILAKGNPHFVCGARVLVKPYREKSKLVDRKFSDNMDHHMYYPSHHMDMEEAEFNSFPRGPEASMLLWKHLMEEQEHAFEIERRRLVQMQLARIPPSTSSYYNFSADCQTIPEDPFDYEISNDNNSSVRFNSNFTNHDSKQSGN